MIKAQNISHALGQRQVLSSVSFEAHTGDHIALVGPNGAGKSTLLQILAGVLIPDDGAVLISGSEMSEISLSERAQAMSFLPQQRELAWDLRVEDVAALGRFAWGGQRYVDLAGETKDAVQKALSDTGADRYFGRRVRSLSGGEQARVHIARVLAGGGQALLLDEPCAALDIRHQLDLMRVLDTARAGGKLIISVLHDLELAERFATRLVVLDGGQIAADTAPNLSGDILEGTFGLKRRKNGGFLKV